MRIESAHDLKAEVLAGMLGSDSGQRVSLGVGIAPRGDREYKLAIRLMSPRDAATPVVREIVERAAHEADIKVLNRVQIADPVSIAQFPRPLEIGASVSHYRATTGSLGFFARRLRDGVTGFVSCNHVIAGQDRGSEGDEILSPGLADRGTRPRDVVGYLDGEYLRLRQSRVETDCAFAQLAGGVSYHPRRIGTSDILRAELASPWEAATLVGKVGRTTGRTVGRVTAFELDNVEVQYAFGPVKLNGQIEIESTGDVPFCRPGDSGSLVFTEDLRPLGLVCASSAAGGAGNLGLAFAAPISTVLTSLGVEILL